MTRSRSSILDAVAPSRAARRSRAPSRVATTPAGMGLTAGLRVEKLDSNRREDVMKRFATVLSTVVVVLATAAPGHAIVFGQLDGNRHPQVGALIADPPDDDPDEGPGIICSGTLIAPDVFLTAGHCTAFLESVGVAAGDVWVTFDPTFDDASPLIGGTYHTHPEFGFQGPGGRSDPHDLAVIVLDGPVMGVTPARLPTLGLLDSLSLRTEWFTAVGYGTVREDKRRGPHSLFFDGQRRFASQSFRSLTKSWLNLSMNPSTGSGGTCFGDSGGPHFLRDSLLIVSITVTGDRFCRASDVTYRLDTASARAFLDDFVAVP
jgi:Trypsin